VLRREEVSYGGGRMGTNGIGRDRVGKGKILSRKGYLASYVLRREEVSYGGGTVPRNQKRRNPILTRIGFAMNDLCNLKKETTYYRFQRPHTTKTGRSILLNIGTNIGIDTKVKKDFTFLQSTASGHYLLV